MQKIILTVFLLFLSTNLCFATDIYDQYGHKTGSYKTNGNTITQYDKYGHKTGSFKTNGNTTTEYDRYGHKTGSYKK